MLTLDDLDVSNQRVILRTDYNVPQENGVIQDTTRIDATLDTLKKLIACNAKITIISHLGRPQRGEFDKKFSLVNVRDYLQTKLNITINLHSLDSIPTLQAGEVAMLENVRYYPGEIENDDALGQKLAQLGDIFINDAFAICHRSQASVVSIAKYCQQKCAGPHLAAELVALDHSMQHAEHPMVAIVGGSKVSSKFELLEHILAAADIVITGGGIANTMLLAQGIDVKDSLCEPDFVAPAQLLFATAEKHNKKFWLPTDVVVAESMDSKPQVKLLNELTAGDKIFDIGPESCKNLQQVLTKAKTILWNGPMGVFEKEQFRSGTNAIVDGIRKSSAFSIAGGGDTIAAINLFQAKDSISYISTGGGAFLEWLEGKTLPGIKALL